MLYKSPVVPILLCSCQTRALLTETERRIHALETKCLKRLVPSFEKLELFGHVAGYDALPKTSGGMWKEEDLVESKRKLKTSAFIRA